MSVGIYLFNLKTVSDILDHPVCTENKYFTPKTALYKALTTDYLDINRELNNHLLVTF